MATRHLDKASRDHLASQGVDFSADFHSLPWALVDLIMEEADARKYRKPASANGSRARCFFYRLTRVA